MKFLCETAVAFSVSNDESFFPEPARVLAAEFR